MQDWIFYHMYPLGFCGAPERNDFCSPSGGGLRSLKECIPHLRELGFNALYIGPLFESTAHGYDTVDYFWVDRRLGTNDDLVDMVRAFHDAGIAVVLDAVFNHTGRHFFAFRDLQNRGFTSPYHGWYKGIDFSRQSPCGDAFSYEGWSGCYDLVTLNGENPEVREHLFQAAEFWIKTFDIDGLRLDVANLLFPGFMDELSARCKRLKNNFWLMGEVIHGDYRNWARQGRLDSVTNYELYKSLWSSFNDKNFFELSWTLNRQFGPDGMYRKIALYNFLDNHDVNRLASMVENPAHLVPLYGLLFSLPGIPSIYYGSEYGIQGERKGSSDSALRPAWNPSLASAGNAHLKNTIAGFIAIRKAHPVIRTGSFTELFRTHEQYAFLREDKGERLLAAVNSAGSPAVIRPKVLGCWHDLLSGEEFCLGSGNGLPLNPAGFRLLAACEDSPTS
jgi:glycosidase